MSPLLLNLPPKESYFSFHHCFCYAQGYGNKILMGFPSIRLFKTDWAPGLAGRETWVPPAYSCQSSKDAESKRVWCKVWAGRGWARGYCRETYQNLNTRMDVSTREGMDTFSHAYTNTHGVEHTHGHERERGNRYIFTRTHKHTQGWTHTGLNTHMYVCAWEGIDTFSHAHTNTHVVEHIHGCEHGRGNRYTFIRPYKHTWGYFTTLTYTVMGAGQSRVYPAACEGGPQAGTNAAVLGKTFFFFREASVCMCVCVNFFFLICIGV